MKDFLRRIFYNLCAMMLIVIIVGGIKTNGFPTLLVVSLVFGLANALVKFITESWIDLPNFRAYFAVACIINCMVFFLLLLAVDKFTIDGFLSLAVGIIILLSLAGAYIAQLEFYEETGRIQWR